MRFLFLLIISSVTNLFAQSDSLSIIMKEFEYPYPVNFFPLSIERQQLQMAYMDIEPAGMKNGKTVVLMHGKNFSSYYWKNTIDELRNKGYRVIAVDQIGFGKSSKPDIYYNIHLLAFNTHQLLQALNISSIILIGHSTGGMIATRYALMYPGEVTDLVLEDPIGLEDYRLIVPYAPLDTLWNEELNMPDETTTKYIQSYFVTWKPEYSIYASVLNRWKRSSQYPQLAKTAALTTQMIYEQPVCYEFHLVKARTLIIVGSEDRTVLRKSKVPVYLLPRAGRFPKMAKKRARQILAGIFAIIKNTGHIPHIESPGDFHRTLFAFL